LNSRIWKIFIVVAAALAVAQCTTDHTRRGYLRAIAEQYGAPPRPAIIIPGFGVTRLLDPVRKRLVWGSAHAMVQTRFEDDLDLPIDADGKPGHDRLVPDRFAGSRGPVNIAWHLEDGLRRFGRYTPERDLFAFAYDWRLDAMENAARLADLVARVQRTTGARKVDIITHSAGAIVAQSYIKLAGGGANVEHLIMIAPVQRGVVDAFRVFVHPERFLRRSFTPEMVVTWPFITELLPEDGRFLVDEHGRTLDRNLWEPRAWDELLTLDARNRRVLAFSLAHARELRGRLKNAPMPAGIDVRVLAGDCVPTAHRVLVRGDGTFAFYPSDLRTGEERLAQTLFEPGDGTVPVSSARNGADAQLFCDGHQGIATDPNVVRTIVRTLREEAPR
jgi:pimeloyl-ACP methyl ester carboxylesterase